MKNFLAITAVLVLCVAFWPVGILVLIVVLGLMGGDDGPNGGQI